jgi:uncharacterized protein (DUF1778 family)
VILANRQLVTLSSAAAEAFTESLNRHASVNRRLAEALKEPGGFHFLG